MGIAKWAGAAPLSCFSHGCSKLQQLMLNMSPDIQESTEGHNWHSVDNGSQVTHGLHGPILRSLESFAVVIFREYMALAATGTTTSVIKGNVPFTAKFSQRNHDGIVIATQGCQRKEKVWHLVLDVLFRLGMANKHSYITAVRTKQLTAFLARNKTKWPSQLLLDEDWALWLQPGPPSALWEPRHHCHQRQHQLFRIQTPLAMAIRWSPRYGCPSLSPDLFLSMNSISEDWIMTESGNEVLGPSFNLTQRQNDHHSKI